MAETTRKNIVGIVALGLLAFAAAGGLLILSSKPQLQPTPPAPPPPVAGKPAVTPPVFDVVRVDADGNAVLAGRAAPGAAIIVKSGQTVIGQATADAQGAFVVVPTGALPAGAQQLELTETLPDGTVIIGDATASINVPAGTGKALAVVSGPNGSQVLSGQGPAAGTLAMGAVDYDANGHAIFAGTAPAGATVTVKLDGKALGQAVADQQGKWHFDADVPKSSGTLTLSASTPSGTSPAPVSVPFALETLSNALAAGHVVISPGDNLWLIARHVYGHGNMYTLIYSANASAIHNPNLIFPGQAFALPKAP